MSASNDWLEEQNKQRQDYQTIEENTTKRSLWDLICSQNVLLWTVILLFSVFIPCSVYFLVIDEGKFTPVPTVTCMIQDNFRIPCGRPNLTSEECWTLLCCFDPRQGLCYHSLPSRYIYTKSDESNIYKTSIKKSPVETHMIPKIMFKVIEKSESIVKIKLEVHRENNSASSEYDSVDVEKNYYVIIDEKKLAVDVFRKKTNERLLSTAGGPLIVSENYFEWSLFMSNGSLFGIDKNLLHLNNGEHGKEYKKVFYYNKFDHFNIPVFWAFSGGNFHRLSIAYKGPLEIIIKASNLIILRSPTLDDIEIELDTGYTPKMLHDEVMKDTKVPPFWAMETHICRSGESLDLQEIVTNFEFDDISTTYCIDENLFMSFMKYNGNNFSAVHSIFNEGIRLNKKFVLSLPPHILNDSYLHKKAEELGILYSYNGTTYVGSYLNEKVVYPDYNDPQISSFISELYKYVNQFVKIPIDGLVLKDNWPSDDNYLMNATDFKYYTKELQHAMSYTLPWNSTSSYSGLQIENHNFYSISHLNAIKNFLETEKLDIFVVSSGSSLGQSEPILVENVNASWDELRNKLQNILFDSIAVNHFVSLPVCGDNSKYDLQNEILCIRWYQIAATLPVLRISSQKPWRDPPFLNTTYATKVAANALNLRNQLLMHYYTLVHFHEPVIRPMFYDFHDDEATFKIETQYMVGGNLLVAHPFTPGRKKLHVYLPKKIGVWYEMWGGKKYNCSVDHWANITVLENDFVGFLAQGSILALENNNTINLVIAENCTDVCSAKGVLFIMDSIVEFSAEDKNLTISNLPSHCNYTLGSTKAYGYGDEIFISNHFNIPLCDRVNNITINYIDKKIEDN